MPHNNCLRSIWNRVKMRADDGERMVSFFFRPLGFTVS